MEQKANLGGKSELLDVLGEVKSRVQDKLGIVDFPMPQFILIGKQSVGKSRLIESLAGEQFNFVSGTLGSRRPTVLEFRNVSAHRDSKWFVRDKKTNQWGEFPLPVVMKMIGDAHEELGVSVSGDPVYVRVESPACVDMQIVDLPGFREYSKDEAAERLASQIDSLVSGFMKDERNVMLCVEEAGDAANLRTLARCKQIDPNFKRTVLIRNKLDKYFRDLTASNVNDWCDGFGDLPKHLVKFSLTLPNWPNENEAPPAPFADLRSQFNQKDVLQLKSLGVSDVYANQIGFQNFSIFMEQKIEELFANAIGPVLARLRELKGTTASKQVYLKTEIDNTNPQNILSTVREAGVSFAHALGHVMEGFVRSPDEHRVTLEQELKSFHTAYETNAATRNDPDWGHFCMLPSSDFNKLDDYIDYLKNEISPPAPACQTEINGGAQFRRLMFEIEVFLRFSEICSDMKRRDVIQARGVSLNSLTWRDVVVKLLTAEAHMPLQRRVQYVGERIKFFFQSQKEAILHFMGSLEGSPDQQMYSALFGKHYRFIAENDMIKQLVFNTYDDVAQRQLDQFIDLFSNMLSSTFSNPWVFLKRTSFELTEGLESVCMPSFEDTKARIPTEIAERGEIEETLEKWLMRIPLEPDQIDDAVDQVSCVVLKTYSYIRSQVCDQVELFAESFFKLPMLRRLEEDMCKIELSECDKQTYAARRELLVTQAEGCETELTEIDFCIEKLQAFSLKAVALRKLSQ